MMRKENRGKSRHAVASARAPPPRRVLARVRADIKAEPMCSDIGPARKSRSGANDRDASMLTPVVSGAYRER